MCDETDEGQRRIRLLATSDTSGVQSGLSVSPPRTTPPNSPDSSVRDYHTYERQFGYTEDEFSKNLRANGEVVKTDGSAYGEFKLDVSRDKELYDRFGSRDFYIFCNSVSDFAKDCSNCVKLRSTVNETSLMICKDCDFITSCNYEMVSHYGVAHLKISLFSDFFVYIDEIMCVNCAEKFITFSDAIKHRQEKCFVNVE